MKLQKNKKKLFFFCFRKRRIKNRINGSNNDNLSYSMIYEQLINILKMHELKFESDVYYCAA